MADDPTRTVQLTPGDLQAVAGYAVGCARPALPIFESVCTGDGRPRAAIAAAHAFEQGAVRSKALRDSAWNAQRAA